MGAPSFLNEIDSRKAERHHQGRDRSLPQNSAPISFSDNDYLGLAKHPAVLLAAQEAIKKHGTSARAARLLAGICPEHQSLESALALWKQSERALLFASGYLTPLGVIPALVGPGDTILLERNAHACLFDGAKLSEARLRLFPRQDMPTLKQMLDSTRKLNPNGKILLVVESLHSMDGDFAPLEEIIRLKSESGAWLLLDEAHAGGICGPEGSGRAAELGLTSLIDLQMGTLGKALGSAGGFIAGQAKIIDHLLNEARTFLFGTALPPASARAALTALSIIQSTEGEQLRQTLRNNINLFRSGSTSTQLGPIHPILCTSNLAATAASHLLKDLGLEVPAIRTPTVPTGTARLRISLSARHSESEIRLLAQSLKKLPNS